MTPNPNTLEKLRDTFEGKLLLTKGEASKILSVSVASINNYITQENNPLVSVKLSSSKKSAVRIPIESLASFINNLTSAKEV